MRDYTLVYARSGNSLRAAIALELCQLNFKRCEISVSDGDQKSSSFLKLNPAGYVPVLIIKDNNTEIALSQSGAIMDFLLSEYRSDLIPTNTIERAKCYSHFYASISDIAIQNALARYLHHHEESSNFIFQRMLNVLLAEFSSLQSGEYLCGDKVSIADYAHFPIVYMREDQLREMSDAQHILDWLNRMKEDPAIIRSIEYAGIQL
ncbi:glutathione S-transferase family protein [Marinomonas agarivorans]|nr:glutathione S-transferase family protein [Marinomonas agarivorans]